MADAILLTCLLRCGSERNNGLFYLVREEKYKKKKEKYKS
jgi:hypothetical protein